MQPWDLTIDSAPTKPNDKASEDVPIVITKVPVRPKIMKFFEKSYLFDKALEKFIYAIWINRLKNAASKSPPYKCDEDLFGSVRLR